MATEKNKPWIPSGEEIEKKLTEKKWTQWELAVITGVSQSTISNIVNEKKPTCTKKMQKIIKALWG